MRMLQRGFGVVTLVLAVIIVVGCSKTKDGGNGGNGGNGHDHDHDAPGPHGGVLIELGDEEYHGEFTVDHKAKKATVYVLGSDPKKSHAIKAETIKLTVKKEDGKNEEIELKAEKKDNKGMSSQFGGEHEMFGKEREFEGRIDLVIDGKAYGGTFKEEHEDED